MDIFRIEQFDYKQRERNLESGIVSSVKFFPVFEVHGKGKNI